MAMKSESAQEKKLGPYRLEHLHVSVSLMQRHVCTLPLQRGTKRSALCLIQQTQSLEHAVSWPDEKSCWWWWWSWG